MKILYGKNKKKILKIYIKFLNYFEKRIKLGNFGIAINNKNIKMNKLKVGVIGTGHLGRVHTMLWMKNTNIEFAGIYDANENRAEEIAKEFNCKVFKTMQETIESCDAVTISAPTVAHFEISKLFLEQGKHCFIEKPITANYNEAVELIEISKKNGTIIQVGHVERFNPAIASLKDMEINPIFIEAHRLSPFRPRAFDVSVIHDLMIHDIDIVLSLIKSKVNKIDANGVAVITHTPDICNARLTFENGSVANLTASRISANQMRKMRIFQKDAYFSIDFAKPDVDIFRLYDEGTEPKDYKPTTMLGSIDAGLKNKNIYFEKPIIPEINAIGEEQQAFVSAINDKTNVRVTAEDAAEALRIAEEISNLI